jgi:hypothetical protein
MAFRYADEGVEFVVTFASVVLERFEKEFGGGNLEEGGGCRSRWAMK